METLVQDLRYCLRMFRKSPLVTAAALFSLAIGIGANAAMFSWLDGLVLSPLRVQEPERLVHLYSTDPSGFRGSYSYLNYRDQRDRNEVFEGAGERSSLRVGCLGREHVPCRDLVIALTALLAGFIPARRAARIDPVTALRYQ